MGLFVTVPVLLIVLYFSSFLFTLFRNYLVARKYDYPMVIVPIHPNHFGWLVLSLIIRKWLKRNLPFWMWWRLSIVIYGWEYHERRLPFKMLNTDSFMLVTCERNELWTIDHEALADVAKRPAEFVLSDIGIFILNMFGSNLATSQGESWVRQRKLLTSIINERISKVVFEESWIQSRGMVTDIENEGNKHMSDDQVDEKPNHSSSAQAITYKDTFPSMKRIASNVLFRSAYGMPQDFKRPIPVKTTGDGADHKPDVVECVQQFAVNLVPAAFVPKQVLLAWPSFLPLASWAHTLGAAKDRFPELVEARLKEEQAAMKSGNGKFQSNLTSMLIQASDFGAGEADEAGKNQEKQMLTLEELRGNMFVFITAGFETTANVLTYALVILMAQPELQDWLCEEIDELFKNHNDEEAVEYAAFYPKAIRCQALLMEILRMYPPVVHISRVTDRKKTSVIKTSKREYEIPPDSHVYGPMPSLHTDPYIWRNLNLSDEEARKTPKSNDPVVETLEDVINKTQDEYMIRPSRWINKQLKQMPDGTMSQTLFQPPRGSFVPFNNGGPRVCPGQKMAQVEFVSVIMGLLKDYKIEAAKKPGETDTQLRQRLQNTLKENHTELTVVMDNLGDIETRFVKRVKV